MRECSDLVIRYEEVDAPVGGASVTACWGSIRVLIQMGRLRYKIFIDRCPKWLLQYSV